MNLTRIIVLANSKKHNDYCLAGIDPNTGKWIRPVTQLDDGRVPKNRMKLPGGHFPEILDLVELPLDAKGNDFGFASENRTLLPGDWRLCGKADVKDLPAHVKREIYVLHNSNKYATVDEMKRKPFDQRTTLELIRVDDFSVRDLRRTPLDNHDWRGAVLSGARTHELSITDPVFCARLNQGHVPSRSCLLTMSLGMPYKPPEWGEKGYAVCWKLIAGVIELPSADEHLTAT